MSTKTLGLNSPSHTYETKGAARSSQATDVRLRRHGLWHLHGSRRGPILACLDGTLWITQEGDLDDHVLSAGQQFAVTRPGTIVVQALRDAVVRLTPQ